MPGGLDLRSAAWRAWQAGLPDDLDPRERYTATLLTMLTTLAATAPFQWALTGGTALQSYLPENDRRYSTDLEVVTPAPGSDVEAWMTAQGWVPKRMATKILLCALTPDGTFFVIHDYPPGDFAAADVTERDFEHFPIQSAPPPEPLEAPLLSLEFLLATKLFAIQENDRGGERKKDAYDLSLGLPLARAVDVMVKLEVYAAHRGRPGAHDEIARSAGAWLQHFTTGGATSFSNWLPSYVPDANPERVQSRLAASVDLLGDVLGDPIEPTDEERCRFLINQLSPADLAQPATALGFKGDPVKQSEKVRDFVVNMLLERTKRPLPRDADALREALKKLAG